MASTAARLCQLCDSPVPVRLTLLGGCNHLFHGPCIGSHLSSNGHCPSPGCGRPATEKDIRELRVDPPQPSGLWGQNAQKGVNEVIAVIRQRLAGHPHSSHASEKDFKEVEDTFELIFEEDAFVNNADPSEGWNKLIDLAKKATPVVALVILGVLCWVYWPLVASFAGVLAENVSAMIMGLAGLLRKYFPEIVSSAIAFFGIFVGKKKLCD